MIENKKYFIDKIKSDKACKFTAYYHYSGVEFRKAHLNLGIFEKETKKLVGVMQWGCSYQENIKLDRYVKENIELDEYLELNRFCMADDQEKNSESQAISLGIKWIKQNMPHIKLLVSYAGRKEGNYGYIYQATNWEYLGYFISRGFWILNDKEVHQLGIYSKMKKEIYDGLVEGLCNRYNIVKHFYSKQFIYIIRLDKSLTLATNLKEYPKPANEHPIQTRTITYKDEPYKSHNEIKREEPVFYWTNEKVYNNQSTRNLYNNFLKSKIAIYDNEGNLEKVVEKAIDLSEEYRIQSIKNAVNKNTPYHGKFFIKIEKDQNPREKINVGGQKQNNKEFSYAPKTPGPNVIARYSADGKLEYVYSKISEAAKEYDKYGIIYSYNNKTPHKNKYFLSLPIGTEVPKEIEVNQKYCKIDDIIFARCVEVAEYLGITRQSVDNARRRKAKTLNKKEVEWYT